MSSFLEPAFNAASYTRRALKNWSVRTTSANSELTDGERRTLTARAYDSYRNDSLARAALSRVKTNVAGMGLNLSPNIDGDLLGLNDDQTMELEDTIEREFTHIWAENCDIRRTFDFAQMQALAIITVLISGDCFVNTTFRERPGDLYGLKLQFVDSERVSNPFGVPDRVKLIKGVEFDNSGAPVAYHVRKTHPADIGLLDANLWEWSRFPAFGRLSGRRRLLHLHELDRPEGARGVSYLAPILEPLKQLGRYNENELMATVLSNAVTFFVESSGEIENSGFTRKEENDDGEEEFDIGGGAVIELKHGRKVNLANPSRPNQSYEAFVMALARQIAAALEMPLDEVLLRFESSFSAARAAMLKAWLFYRTRRKFLSKMFCQPIYRLWFDEAVARNILPHIINYGDPRRRLAYTNALWIGTGRGAIDELKEAQAAGKRLELGVTSLQLEAANISGESLKTLIKQQKRAIKLYEKAGLTFPTFNSKKQQQQTQPRQQRNFQDNGANGISQKLDEIAQYFKARKI
jgi:lambda family phage portal protein